MTLRAVELHRVWMQILCRMFMEKKNKKKNCVLFHPASPFFHLRAQSSFNKACFLLRRHYPPPP